MSFTTLTSVVGKITKKAPSFHRLLVGVYHIFVFEIWPRLSSHRSLKGKEGILEEGLQGFLSLQSVRSLKINLSTIETDSDLIRSLDDANVPFAEGGWTIYLPPSKALFEIFPELNDYPQPSGVKILRHIAPPQEAVYTSNSLRPAAGASAVRSKTPSPKELLRIAGMMYNYGIGPKVHDLVEIEFGHASATAFIIEHVQNPKAVTSADHRLFMQKVNGLVSSGIAAIHHGDTIFSKDFKAPDCNGNLMKSEDNRLLYVDFQSFRYRNERKAFDDWANRYGQEILFGPKRMGRDKDYFYQMVPGVGDAKRGTLTRWNNIENLLEKTRIDFTNRFIFDIGCNTGLMSYFALCNGAKWAFGWDKPIVAEAAEKLLYLLGATRWNAFGVDLNKNIDFSACLPVNNPIDKDGVLLYLAISKHIGFPSKIADLPWKYCVYEGHSQQDLTYSKKLIISSNWGGSIRILGETLIKDNDNPARSLVVFCR
jgi:hypothetical protein